MIELAHTRRRVPALRRAAVYVRSGILWCAVVLAGCAAPPDDIEPVSRDVALLTTSIKAALIESPEVDAAAIRVEVDESSIVLDGFVATDQEAERAESIARTLVPDRPIRNELVVK